MTYRRKWIDAVLLAGCVVLGTAASVSAAEQNEAIKETVTENNYGDYIQTVYDGQTGIPGTTVNDIASTEDGVLWIGSYNGLYRYNGREFKWMNQFETIKNVNCFYLDEDGSLWIGTNDDGVSVYKDGEIIATVDRATGLPNDTIKSITQDADGDYYIGTADSLTAVRLDEQDQIEVGKVFDEIKYAHSSDHSTDGYVAEVTDDGSLYLIKEGEILDTIGDGSFQFNCVSYLADGLAYAGTTDDTIIRFDTSEGKLKRIDTIKCGSLVNIQDIYETEEGTIFVASDTAVGYLDSNNRFVGINTNNYNSSIDNVTEDYQGNIWFTSSRLGLLKLSPSPFTEMFSAAGLSSVVVNTEIKWGDRMYFGTDRGLAIIDENGKQVREDALLDTFDGLRIRSLFVDSDNNLWVATHGHGLFCIDESGKRRVYSSVNGLPSDKVRCVIELADGTKAVGNDGGIAYISKDGKIIDTIGRDEGLPNSKVLSLEMMENGDILAGTDGGGIARVSADREIVEIYSKENGKLSSNVVMRTIALSGVGGHIIVAGNGLNYLDPDGNTRKLENFPFNNNFDVKDFGGEKVFVLCSAGIYVVDKTDLLEDKETDYELLDHRRGLRGSITANAWNYVSDDGYLYIACDTGCSRLDYVNYDSVKKDYRIMVDVYSVDGEENTVTDKGDNMIEKSASTVSLYPEVINYTSIDPLVSFEMEGFDDKPVILHQSELGKIDYKKLPAGSYKFRLSVLDSKGRNTVETMNWSFEKEREIYEYAWFNWLIGLIFVAVATGITWGVAQYRMKRKMQKQEAELAAAKEQVRMGNETILAIARTVDAKDVNTSQHSRRVSEYSVMIARELGYSEEKLDNLRKIALLHDIGKIGIPDAVLNKPGKLTDEEYAIMKSHVTAGAEILKGFTLVENVADGVLYHHERYDGRGYANGLAGEAIPLNGRIICVADAFDAMTANRVYRKKLDFDYVRSELVNGKGKQFDPKLVDIMLRLIDSGKIDVNELYGK